jgi:chromosome segregation ATPase
MNTINVISLAIPSAIAALGAWAASRASAKAQAKNAQTTSRTEMEKEAYDRARKYDTETIARQDAEIEEVRAQNLHLNNDIRMLAEENRELREEVSMLRRRLVRVERGIPAPANSDEPILERATDTNPFMPRSP